MSTLTYGPDSLILPLWLMPESRANWLAESLPTLSLLEILVPEADFVTGTENQENTDEAISTLQKICQILVYECVLCECVLYE